MWATILSLFPKEVIVALSSILVAAAIDAGLTALLAVFGKLGQAFSWKKLPQFLLSNVLWPAVGLIAAGALLKWFPDMQEAYFAATLALDAWLAKDWRMKFNVLVGFRPPEAIHGGFLMAASELKPSTGGEPPAPPQN